MDHQPCKEKWMNHSPISPLQTPKQRKQKEHKKVFLFSPIFSSQPRHPLTLLTLSTFFLYSKKLATSFSFTLFSCPKQKATFFFSLLSLQLTLISSSLHGFYSQILRGLHGIAIRWGVVKTVHSRGNLVCPWQCWVRWEWNGWQLKWSWRAWGGSSWSGCGTAAVSHDGRGKLHGERVPWPFVQ